MLRRVALVRTDVSEECRASFIRMTRIGELGTTLAVTSNRRTLRRNAKLTMFRSSDSSVSRYGKRSHAAPNRCLLFLITFRNFFVMKPVKLWTLVVSAKANVKLGVTNQNLTQEEINKRLNSTNVCYHSVQNLLSSRLQSRNIRIRLCKTIILPVVLMGRNVEGGCLRIRCWGKYLGQNKQTNKQTPRF
jgi:hypothetical protein